MDPRPAIWLLLGVTAFGGLLYVLLVRVWKSRCRRRRKADIAELAMLCAEATETGDNSIEPQQQAPDDADRDRATGYLEQPPERMTIYPERIRTLLDRIAANVEGSPTATDPSNEQAPLLSMLGFMTTVNAVLLEVIVLVGRSVSGGRWPAPITEAVVTGVFVLAVAYHLTLRKRYQKYDGLLKTARLTKFQIVVIVCWCVAWGGLVGWVAFGP